MLYYYYYYYFYSYWITTGTKEEAKNTVDGF
jgi:hypothetical protein